MQLSQRATRAIANTPDPKIAKVYAYAVTTKAPTDYFPVWVQQLGWSKNFLEKDDLNPDFLKYWIGLWGNKAKWGAYNISFRYAVYGQPTAVKKSFQRALKRLSEFCPNCTQEEFEAKAIRVTIDYINSTAFNPDKVQFLMKNFNFVWKEASGISELLNRVSEYDGDWTTPVAENPWDNITPPRRKSIAR